MNGKVHQNSRQENWHESTTFQREDEKLEGHWGGGLVKYHIPMMDNLVGKVWHERNTICSKQGWKVWRVFARKGLAAKYIIFLWWTAKWHKKISNWMNNKTLNLWASLHFVFWF